MTPMTISRVTKYVTSDGREFKQRPDAEAHEKVVETEKVLRDLLAPGLATGRIDAVIAVMVNHAVEVRDELSKFIRRQPKK